MPFCERVEARLKEEPNAASPKPGLHHYTGWYLAPDGKRYFGYGNVIETGITHDGSRYVKVEPDFLFYESEWNFFDPFTGEDMDIELYPNRGVRWRDRRLKWFFCDRFDLKPGDIAPGHYISPRSTRYWGIGRVVQNIRDKSGKHVQYEVEPMGGSSMRGPYRFRELSTSIRIPDSELPRSAYTGTHEMQQQENKDRPRRPLSPSPALAQFYGGLPFPIPESGFIPDLGTEHSGVYFRPDGQWFAGVGKVVAIGRSNVTEPGDLYVFVEPIPGKSGGDYDFFHPHTMLWMDELPSNPVPGVECTPAQRETLPPRWRKLPAICTKPKLGDESPGRYLPPKAPRQEVYVGVGKVVKTGLDEQGKIWVDVEPIAGKSEGDYKFFDPFTGKDMPDHLLDERFDEMYLC
ncbi:hypothetical protein BDV18DRAFT_159921 [Aspergillus unguis]